MQMSINLAMKSIKDFSCDFFFSLAHETGLDEQNLVIINGAKVLISHSIVNDENNEITSVSIVISCLLDVTLNRSFSISCV